MAARNERNGAFPRVPWAGAAEPDLAFVVLEATGCDTALDRLSRVQASRSGEGGSWRELDRECGASRPAGAAAAAFAELAQLVRGARVVVSEREAFVPWAQHFGANELAAAAIGADELAALLSPSRAHRRTSPPPSDVEALVRDLAEIVGRFQALPEQAHALAAAAWTASWWKLCESDPATASRLARALELVERPSRWRGSPSGAACELRDGVLGASLRCDPEDAGELVRSEIDEMRPLWASAGDRWRELDTVPVALDGAAPLGEEDLALVDSIFREHLPALFAGPGGAACYREGQHQVARAVAGTLGSRKLLLVHAPTGTGKTLSYLVHALLWSLRNGVRVAVSTYTRALQEQAVEQEVPRALAALARAGVAAAPRITVLKGRANYLCWRALRYHVPGEGDGGESWLAWASAMLFAWTDEDGDLDRFPMRVALAAEPRSGYQRELESLVRSVRAAPGCCRGRSDRETCAAEVARQRAERSHLIVTNHAFALIRPNYFRHVVFDECEHLHDQAGGAWSWSVTLREIRELLVRLRQPGRPNSRAPLDRLERLTLEGDPAHPFLAGCRDAWFEALGALDALQAAVGGFKAWREQEQRKRDPRDQHSLLREYVEAAGGEGARALLEAHRALCAAASELDANLSRLATELESIPATNVARLRRALELARGDMLEWLEALRNWLPAVDGVPAFVPERFYDVEQDGRGDDLLAARVLLPNEILGRSYYPGLDSAVLISATTWLRGGFETATSYLGLDRAMQPLESEERAPSVVETFRAGDPFDYGRVLVCVPNDAPDLSRSRETFQAYVRRFVAHLGERTRGRMLVLFTASEEARRTGEELSGFFRARGIPLWFQNMSGVRKEELGELFRRRVDSCLFGVDTFWYGADFPGETLEYVVIVKLPYGVPDRYHHAQCAALGASEQRRRIYLPRALAKFRQGFGRLMRRESDRGCVFVLDSRVLWGAHRLFLGELPLRSEVGRAPDAEWPATGSRLVVDTSERCLQAAFEHMELPGELVRRGLEAPFETHPAAPAPPGARAAAQEPRILDVAPGDVPF
jgi:ATP-dependent DNA helicase DinG